MKLTILLTFLFINAFAMPQPFMAWNEVYNQDGIKISYDITSCNGARMIYWKLENSTGQTRYIDVSGSITEGNFKQDFQFKRHIPANQALEGNCSQTQSPTTPCLSLNYNFINASVNLSVK